MTTNLSMIFLQDRETSFSNDAESDVAFQLTNLNRSYAGDGSRRSGGDGLPSGDPVSSSTGISYTWRDINVFTSSAQGRRRKLFFSRSSEPSDIVTKKHILKNGKCLKIYL